MNPVSTGKVGLWKSELSQSEVILADTLAGKPARLLGYAKSIESPGSADLLKAIPWVIYAHLLFRLMVMGSYTPYPVSR